MKMKLNEKHLCVYVTMSSYVFNVKGAFLCFLLATTHRKELNINVDKKFEH